ncbi:DUF6313 family protein [Actinoplanes sp. NBC_00393]|uniref:DUF6313 family protein n=1 Tax=Actinoplanes sp. NBC_00393 TaxID=2975953 RepID=UPI002E1D0F87
MAHLSRRTANFNVPNDFVERFVKLHDEEWKTAEEHWEILVSKVLNTDAVDANATRRRAIYQAVAATVTLLERTDLRERCPECVFAPTRRRWIRPWSWWRR